MIIRLFLFSLCLSLSFGFNKIGKCIAGNKLCLRMELTETALLSKPPTTFLNCVSQSVGAVKQALKDDFKLVEVEFPPLPLEVLEDSSSSARSIADANTRWAIEFAQSFADEGKKVSVIYPDQAELDDAIKYVDMGETTTPFKNIRLATIRSDSVKNAKSLDQVLLSIFGATVGGTVEAVPDTDIYIAVVSSTQELSDIEKLHLIDTSKPIVLFNLRLDILRGDLGLPLFPSRDLHHRFLSKVKPAYILRSRAFATSLRRPPFIINYSGVLFRNYPEPFQCILNTGAGSSRAAKVVLERPTNMAFRDALTNSLKIPGVSADELKAAGNLVWWEKEYDKDISKNWIT